MTLDRCSCSRSGHILTPLHFVLCSSKSAVSPSTRVAKVSLLDCYCCKQLHGPEYTFDSEQRPVATIRCKIVRFHAVASKAQFSCSLPKQQAARMQALQRGQRVSCSYYRCLCDSLMWHKPARHTRVAGAVWTLAKTRAMTR